LEGNPRNLAVRTPLLLRPVAIMPVQRPRQYGAAGYRPSQD